MVRLALISAKPRFEIRLRCRIGGKCDREHRLQPGSLVLIRGSLPRYAISELLEPGLLLRINLRYAPPTHTCEREFLYSESDRLDKITKDGQLLNVDTM